MKKLAIIIMLIFAVGCTKKYAKETAEPGAQDEQMMEETMGMEAQEEVVEDIVVAEQEIVEEEIEEPALSAEEEAAAVFTDIHFDFDKYVIREDARPTLDNIASFLSEHDNMNIVIEGHCDERGTNSYNLALGEKRAKATRDYLVSLGVSPIKMIIITYGEEKQLCFEHEESCWQQNRRSHFAIVKE